jgi:hypothetical protein
MGSLAQQCRHEARRSHSLGGNPNIGWNFLSGHCESQNPLLVLISGAHFGNTGAHCDEWNIGEEAMWMRSCAVFKALMMKLRLSAVGVGGSGSGRAIQIDDIVVDQDAGILQDEGEAVMARVIEFYIPTNFRRKVASVPPQSQPGKVIEFCLLAKKSA